MSDVLSLRKVAALLPAVLKREGENIVSAEGRALLYGDGKDSFTFAEALTDRFPFLSAVHISVQKSEDREFLALRFAGESRAVLKELRRQHLDVRSILSSCADDASIKELLLELSSEEDISPSSLLIQSGISSESKDKFKDFAVKREDLSFAAIRPVIRAESLSREEAERHECFMKEALKEAQKAFDAGEVPVGAVCVDSAGNIIGKGFNTTLSSSDPAGHAEIAALRQAAAYTKSARLSGCTLYVSLEPCCMCIGAVMHARIGTLVFGASEPRTGACGSVFNLASDLRQQHRIKLVSGVAEKECAALLKSFFACRRKNTEC